MEAHEQKIMQARMALVLDQPFFGVLALRLRIKADPTCKTAWVDGRTLGYNPTFIESLTHGELVGLVAHEVMHCATGHPWRRDLRDPKKWNVAADHAINPILLDSGFKLPEGALFNPDYAGKSAEWIYARQPEPQESGDEGDEGKPEQGDGEQGDDSTSQGSGDQDDESSDDADGDEQDDEGEQPGEVRDAPSDTTEDGATEEEWSAAVQQAAKAAQAAGKLTGELERFAADKAQTKIDWRSALRRFVQEVTTADYAWQRPNRRYMAQGLYLPELHADQMGEIVVGIDTSGSIDAVLLAQFEAELRAIVDEAKPSRVHVMYADAAVKRTDTFEPDDEIVINAEGGGGTAFGPLFDAVEQLEVQPACIIYLTDLEPWGENAWPAVEPLAPTLWATTRVHDVPFGEVLPIND